MNNDPLIYEKLHQTALNAPKLSGVYLWRDENQTVIYVGKAKVLKNRLSSYFSGKKDIKTRTLVSKASSIEYITTSNEYEALILENTLIKKYSPRYNINLKDDKTYPVLRVTNEDFPRIFATRRIVEDGSRYFGPFPNANALSLYIENLHKQYKLRHCKKFHKRSSPCMYYHIARCDAPCCQKISKQAYNEIIDEILHFLEGNGDESIQKLKDEMYQEAKNLNFEKAARLRDGIKAIQLLHAKNDVMDFNYDSRDYIGFATEGTMVSFAVLRMRDGRLIMRDLHRTRSLNCDTDLMNEFLVAYYNDASSFPQKIFVPLKIDTELFLKYASDQFEKAPQIIVVEPDIEQNSAEFGRNSSERVGADGCSERDGASVDEESGVAAGLAHETTSEERVAAGQDAGEMRHKSAMNMAYQNAYEDIIRRKREEMDVPALTELKNLFNLKTLPVRIEGFDIAHIGGNLPVASLISFYNGNPDKKNYRYFRLKTTDGIIDDFASMREATARRYTRLLNEGLPLPDLILIDGGIGQVNAVQGVLDSLDLDIPILGLAEKNEDIYRPGNSTPLRLPRRSDALRLLQRVRDECHRFATTKNQNLRTKTNTLGEFTKLPYVGSKRAAILNATYGTLQNLIESVRGSAHNCTLSNNAHDTANNDKLKTTDNSAHNAALVNRVPNNAAPSSAVGIEKLACVLCVSEERASEIYQAAVILVEGNE